MENQIYRISASDSDPAAKIDQNHSRKAAACLVSTVHDPTPSYPSPSRMLLTLAPRYVGAQRLDARKGLMESVAKDAPN